MKAAIIGHGKMGREIEKILLERGHRIGAVIDEANASELDAAHLVGIDVALEFTTPDAAYGNIRACIDAGIPVVSGTTGWTNRLEELRSYCREKDGALFYASNYCLGVNLMFRLNRRLARMMERFDAYDVRIEEIHHTQKKDAPSGTAITLAEGIISEIGRKTGWVNESSDDPSQIVVTSLREGTVPGTHTVTYESDDDRIENIRRAAEVAGLFRDAGLVTLCTFISPFAAGRAEARRIADGRFLEVWVRAGLETCKARDPKKLYQKALEGKIRSFTGIDSPYEEPTDAELVLDTEVLSEEECVNRLTDAVFDYLEGGDTL